MKLKIIKNCSLILMVLSSVYVLILNISRKVNVIKNEKIIDNWNSNNVNYNYVDDSIIGYLEINNLNIKNIIKNGVSENILDENVIGMPEGIEIGQNNNDVFLAGHNIKEVFRNLHSIKKGDIVKITTKDSCYKYKVTEIIIVNDEDINYMINNHQNRLTMMTCTNKSNKRLIVICELI